MSQARLKNKMIEIFVTGVLLFLIGLTSLILTIIYRPVIYLIIVTSLATLTGIMFIFLGINRFKTKNRSF